MVGGSYNVGGYTMVVCSTLHKQLCWEFGVSHNCICIISEGPLMYMVTCLETLCSQLILLISIIRFFLKLTCYSHSTSHCGASNRPLYLEIDLKT